MEKDKYSRYLENESESSLTALGFNRREFLEITSAGIFVFFTIGNVKATLQRRGGREYPSNFNAYLKINEDGRVSCFSGKIEMGQGIITSLAQMLAEEMEVSLDAIDMIMGDTALCPYDSGTFGSRSTKYFGPPLRKAAAQAKAVLLQLASEQLNLPVNRLLVKNGLIQDAEGKKKISYAMLARGKKIERYLPDIPIKHYSQHTISGKPTQRTDALEKVTGKAQFSGDIQLKGMLYAKICRPPAHGAILKRVNSSVAEKIKGVKFVHDGQLVAALHENPEVAEKALKAISAEFKENNLAINNQNIFSHLQSKPSYGEVIAEEGNIEQGKKQSQNVIKSTFYNHYVAHAPMEPHTVVAEVIGERARVWASTQTPFRVQKAVAEELDIPLEKVQVITPFLGGGFGGKKIGLYILEAVRLAKITARPVQVALTRKEEFFYDTFRPAAVIKLSSGIDSEGKIRFWDYDNYYAGSRSSQPIYDILNYRIQSRRLKNDDEDIHPFDVGAWRGPGSNTNVFAMESQTDILAEAAGMDPLSFRMKNLSDQRMIKVLKAAAEKFGYAFSKGPSGKGFGIACTNYLNTYVATLAQVEVDDKTGNVQVIKMVCAQDMGEIINPQGAQLQIEGGLTMGLSAVLSEEIQFEGGNILTENFGDYEITRFSQAPEINVVLIDNPDLPPQGCGEPAITTTGAVIANAIYDASGARLHTLPMTPERILAAL